MLDIDPEVVNAVFEDFERAPITPRLAAALAIAEAMTKRPGEPMTGVIDRARGAGLDEAAIEDAANVAFHFNLINRVADAFDFDLPQGDGLSALATMLQRAKIMRVPARAEPSIVRVDQDVVRPVEVQHGHEILLGAAGVTAPELRTAVEAFTSGLRGGARPALPVPETLHPYLRKLALHAYRIVDEDIEALCAAGYDTDAIFELTFAGAWGASLGPLEALLGAASK